MSDLVYYQNMYGEGHEQREKRPYFVIYQNEQFVLAFPKTTRNKQHKEYPSHKNYILGDSEVMIDQLQVIPKAQILEQTRETKLSIQLLTMSMSAHRKPLIEHFLEQIVLQDKPYETKAVKEIAFGDILSMRNENPILNKYDTFIVLSHAKFHLSSMCLVAPCKHKSIVFKLLHCMDFQEREFQIRDDDYVKKLEPTALYDQIKTFLSKL
ncbi:type II toxin-antitoxin system PemK/MazF family toxin [Helicobacter baculiformis]|uniref:Type II toxin-antitoxin system PemK/MazF family toxin n=1 Tax=Helicobacter baculiformis TaxID=427351 RepID=A0ABV7ZIJ1_9HELI|nr:type II toxin-antitoxin system PemK/MazF family toxin [Helicobacter baculiformis]